MEARPTPSKASLPFLLSASDVSRKPPQPAQIPTKDAPTSDITMREDLSWHYTITNLDVGIKPAEVPDSSYTYGCKDPRMDFAYLLNTPSNIGTETTPQPGNKSCKDNDVRQNRRLLQKAGKQNPSPDGPPKRKDSAHSYYSFITDTTATATIPSISVTMHPLRARRRKRGREDSLEQDRGKIIDTMNEELEREKEEEKDRETDEEREEEQYLEHREREDKGSRESSGEERERADNFVEYPTTATQKRKQKVSLRKAEAEGEDSKISIVLPPRKRRKRLTPIQRTTLEGTYAIDKHPSRARKEALARELGLTPPQIQAWYLSSFCCFFYLLIFFTSTTLSLCLLYLSSRFFQRRNENDSFPSPFLVTVAILSRSSLSFVFFTFPICFEIVPVP